MALPAVYQVPLISPEKRCKICGAMKQLRDFTPSKRHKDGLLRTCKACLNASRAARLATDPLYAAAHRAQRVAYRDRTREQKQQHDSAYYRTHADEIKARVRSYGRAHQEASRVQKRAWRAANRELARARRRAWESAHPEKTRELQRAKTARYRASHPERIVIWKAQNPLKIKAMDHLRRARKLAAEGFYTPQDIQTLEKAQTGLCAYCQRPYGKYHIEHKQPLVLGGSNWPINICLSCPRCNLGKGASTEDAFRARLANEYAQ